MKISHIRFFITALFLAFCAGGPVSALAQQETRDYTSIKLKDKFDNPLRKGAWDEVFKHHEAEFAPLYLGDAKSEIKLTYKPELTGNRIENEDGQYKKPSDSTLLIYIDTSRIIGCPMSVWEYYKKPEYRRDIMAFPVFLENISTDTLIVGFGDVLLVTIEAKDKDGQWYSILRPFYYGCGTDLKSIYLAPHQIAVTALPICKGYSCKELRLVFLLSHNQHIYSNIITYFLDE